MFIGNSITHMMNWWEALGILTPNAAGGYNLQNALTKGYIVPTSGGGQTTMSTSTKVPSKGWNIEPVGTTGYFIIVSGTNQINHNNGNAIVYNWGGGNNVNYAFYSDDFGETWNLLGEPHDCPIPSGGDEPKAEELPDGSTTGSTFFIHGTDNNSLNVRAPYLALWESANVFTDNGSRIELLAVDYKFPEVEGIDSATTCQENATVYDLQGRRVSKTGKGVFISNGKTVIR